MICLKIRTFVVSATTRRPRALRRTQLWFAWKFVPLWYQQQHRLLKPLFPSGCDLLENSYLCGISNNLNEPIKPAEPVVICLKIRTFVVSATTCASNSSFWPLLWFAWKFVPLWYQQQQPELGYIAHIRCDLLENSYLCGISNNLVDSYAGEVALWFAWKFVPLWYQQQPALTSAGPTACCDLLENSYLCGISNNRI